MINIVPTKGLPESILKCRFPSTDKPLKKSLLQNISAGAYFRNFTVTFVLSPEFRMWSIYTTVKKGSKATVSSACPHVRGIFVSYRDDLASNLRKKNSEPLMCNWSGCGSVCGILNRIAVWFIVVIFQTVFKFKNNNKFQWKMRRIYTFVGKNPQNWRPGSWKKKMQRKGQAQSWEFMNYCRTATEHQHSIER